MNIEFDSYRQKLNDCRPALEGLAESLNVQGLKLELERLHAMQEAPGFWDDPEKSQKIVVKTRQAEQKIERYEKMVSTWDDLMTICEMAAEEDDDSMLEELKEGFAKLAEEMESCRLETLLTGKYDKNNAMMSFQAGAGGTEAQDWAQMLYRMIQPPIIKLCTTKAERKIRMQYKGKPVSKTARILFPIVVTMIVGVVAPDAVALIGFLMFGNLIRECGVMDQISETAQNALANLITIFLGITIASQMKAADFLQVDTLVIIGLGLIAFIFDTFGGVMVAKVMNLFLKEKINPMIGAAGISAFPMSARVVHKMGLEEDNQNFLLMHSIGVNVSGQIASVIAGGLILALVKATIGG